MALGIPPELVSLPEVAHLIAELVIPKEKGRMSEAEADERAAKIRERQDREIAWERAIHTGYRGERGQHAPQLRATPDLPAPARTPILHTGTRLSMRS